MKILVVAPHPDDEAIGCGGYILRNVAAGNQVVVTFLTNGEHGCPGLSLEESSRIRRSEALEASSVLGSEVVQFWNLPDGKLFYSDDLRIEMQTFIEELKPDVVLVTHERESHPDHRAAGEIVRRAVARIEKRPEVLTYEVWTPHTRTDRILDITNEMSQKLLAVSKHDSQVQRQNFAASTEALARYRGVMQGRCTFAEAFGRMRTSGKDNMRITLALLTWAPSVDHPRAEYARRTLDAALSYIDPGDNELHVHIADDGSDPEHIETLIRIARDNGYDPSVTNAERGGYGRSYNLMMQTVHPMSDIVLPLEDDWELSRTLKLEHMAKVLENSNGKIRSIRLGYLGFTQELKGRVVSESGQIFLLLDPDSAEPHVFAGHPRLETVEYQRDVGVWPEGIPAGSTEWEVAHRMPARTGVAWPLDLSIPASQDWGTLFAHIGSEGVGEIEPGK